MRGGEAAAHAAFESGKELLRGDGPIGSAGLGIEGIQS